MEEESFEVLNAAEIEHYILSLRPTKIDELGTELWVKPPNYFFTYFIRQSLIYLFTFRWLQTHELMQKLSQQAVLEASEHREEVVKELIATHSKASKIKLFSRRNFCLPS